MNSSVSPSTMTTTILASGSSHRDLLSLFKDPDMTFANIIASAQGISPSFAGFVYEACWRLVIAARIAVSDAEVNVGNSNKGFVALRDFRADLFDRNIVSGSSDGFSDITWKSGANTWISTCKLISESASLEDYDLDKLSSLAEKYPNASRAVFVKNKKVFESTFKSARSTQGRHYHRVFDIADLDSHVPQLRRLLTIYNGDIDAIATGYMPNIRKTTMKLYFHQILARLSRRRMSRTAAVLLELKCRSGKSYIMADDILQFQSKTVLILTPIPSETKKALLKMFDGLVEFSSYNVRELKRGTKIPSTTAPMILVASKQFFDKNVDREDLVSLKFDAVYFDEFHFAGLTSKARAIFKKHVGTTTRFVTLTGTGEKPRRDFGIPASQTFGWALHHESLARSGDVRSLMAAYGEDLVTEALELTYGKDRDYSADLKQAYSSTPVLTHFGVTFSREFLKRFKEFEDREGHSFDIAELLRVKEDRTFAHPEKVAELLDLHFGRSGPAKSTMARIRSYGTRTGQVGESYYQGGGGATQFWFLPEGGEYGIHGTCECMKRAIETHRGYGKRYAVVSFNGKSLPDSREGLEAAILRAEETAKSEGKEGLIVLLGSMGNMGISIPRADITVMLNNTHEMDRYIQMIMRCMTEDRHEDAQKQKSRGFVVDYNQKRLLRFCMSLVPTGHSTVDGILRRAAEIIDIDAADFVTNNKTDVVEELLSLWKSSDINRLEEIRNRLETSSEMSLTSADYTSLRAFMREVSSTTSSRKPVTLELHGGEDKIPDGVVSETSTSETESEDKKEEEEPVVDLALEILRTIPYYVAIMTSRNPDSDILTLLESIRADKESHESFCDACKSWWAGAEMEGFLECVMDIFRNRCDLHTRREINAAIKMMKVEVTRMLDNKKQLLELINSMLAPKLHEKATFGEVFTPIELVEMMLDNLPAEVWVNPALRWFDPTVGIGNFMVCVYYRLMEGLKGAIPDALARKEHILTRMLFMSEIGAKNITTCRVVFENKCNLHSGDTLQLNVRNTWGFDKFDVIVGNPPYNKGGIRSSTGSMLGEKNETLWRAFVEQANDLLVDGGYLCFVTPLAWLKKTEVMEPARKILLSNHLSWLALWDDSKAKQGMSADIPLSFYVMHKSPNVNKLPTHIVSNIVRQGVDTLSDVYLDVEHTIPFAHHGIFDKIRTKLAKHPEIQLDILRKTVKAEGADMVLPKSYAPGDAFGVSTVRIKDGVIVKKMAAPHPDADKRKLIIASKTSFAGAFIDDGRLGLVGSDKCYIVGDDLEKLKSFFDSKIAAMVCNFTRYRQHFLDRPAYDFVFDVRKIPASELPAVTDEHLANYLGLTLAEKKALGITA
jgi:superfamily II DNA or RNA helicase